MQMTWLLCGESGEDLNVMIGCFYEVSKRVGPKVNGGESKAIVLGGAYLVV